MIQKSKSEWFQLDSPIGEPEIKWHDKSYHIERLVNSDGVTVWFGQDTNWKKEPDVSWSKLSTNYDAEPLKKYLPDIVYGEDRHVWEECEMPIYEKLYLELKVKAAAQKAQIHRKPTGEGESSEEYIAK